MPDFHVDLVALVFGMIVFVLTFSHLKFETNQNKKDIAVLWKRHDDLSAELREDLKSVSSELAEMKSSLSRIEGILSVRINRE